MANLMPLHEVREFDLAAESLRDLNSFLHQQKPGQAGPQIQVKNPDGAHSIAVGLNADLDVQIHGHVGYYVAGMNKHASVTVHGNAGPGAAEIGYIFGAASQTLSIVNVGWATGAEPTAEQRNAMADAGQQLAAYFRSGPAPAKTQGPTPVGTNGLVLYIAVDKKNAGVEVAVDGVEYHGKSGDKPVASPPPTGPASLHLAYALNVDKPDVKTLKPGSF